MSTPTRRLSRTGPPSSPVQPLLGLIERGFDWLARALEAREQRRALLGLSDVMLKDIGISRADAEREAARPFWDLPRIARASGRVARDRAAGAGKRGAADCAMPSMMRAGMACG